MEFDITKVERFALSKGKKSDVELTEEEISFMANIFYTIINSDNYDNIIMYLAGIHGMSISDIKFIRNVYAYYIAPDEDKKIYYDKVKSLKNEKRKRGFIDLSAMLAFTIFIGVVGLTLAVFIYNFN